MAEPPTVPCMAGPDYATNIITGSSEVDIDTVLIGGEADLSDQNGFQNAQLDYNITDSVYPWNSTSCGFPNFTISDKEEDLRSNSTRYIWTADVIQRVASLVVIMVITLIGNVIIIIVLTCSKYRKRNSRVNIFIINLAIGDLTVCFVTMTSEILFVAFGEWVLGDVACKIITYGQVVTLASTTFILTSMSFDRYLAICRPLAFGPTTSRAKKMIVISWILAFIFSIPQLLIFVQIEKEVHGRIELRCESQGYTAFWQRKMYFTFMTTYILVVPAILISYFYINVVLVVMKQGKEIASSKENGTALRRAVVDKRAIPRAKIKTIKMTFAIIATFLACWTPYFVTTLIRIYSNYLYIIPKSVMVFAETTALLQSAVNPLLYGFFNIKLKRGLMEVFCPHKLSSPYNRYHTVNGAYVTECMSMSEYYNVLNTQQAGMRASLRPKESSSSGGSYERSRGQNNIITEENKNGFKLRVRFTSKEGSSAHSKSDDEREESLIDIQYATAI